MVDVVVVGAGLSGCLAAIALSQRGFQVAIVDRYKNYPADFRAEQIVGSQLKSFSDLGLLDKIVAEVRPVLQARNFILGKQLSSVLMPHYGMPYQDIVRAMRSQVPANVRFTFGRVTDIETCDDPVVRIDDGQSITAKLVVMATGLNTALSERLGIRYEAISARHSTTVGFNIASTKCHAADTPILVYYGNKLQDGIDYLTIFPCKDVLRGNLFLYRDPSDPWVRQLRQSPRETLLDVLPELRNELGDFTITQVQCRSSDVTVARDHQRDGIVFIGDSYQTSCPAAGTGIGRLAVDVERLTVHAVRWFRDGDMSASSLRSYYDDPVKRRSDRNAIQKAHFRRSISTNASLPWKIRRQNVKAKRFVKYIVTDATHTVLRTAANRHYLKRAKQSERINIQHTTLLLWERMMEWAGIVLRQPPRI